MNNGEERERCSRFSVREQEYYCALVYAAAAPAGFH